MKKYSVKLLKEYKGPLQFDEKKILASLRRVRGFHKLPTSIALEVSTIRDLKKLAVKKGVPYQVLMRMLIVEGLRRAKKAA